MDSFEGQFFEGSFSLPLADRLGIQFDRIYTEAEGTEFYGLGGHFFARESEKGLIGITGGALWGDFVDSLELSFEAEYYFDSFTIGAKAGWASIEYDQAVPFIDTDRDTAFGQLFASFYPIEDLAVTAAIENRLENSYASIEVDYQLPISGLSIFASGMTGEHDYDHAYIGLSYAFGTGEKALKLRHREDRLRTVLRDIQFGVGNYKADYNQKDESYTAENNLGNYSGNYGGVSFGSSVDYVFVTGFDNSAIVVAPESIQVELPATPSP